MIFTDEYEWRRLNEVAVGDLSAEEVYAALTKGADAPKYGRRYSPTFEPEDKSLYCSFSEFSSDIYHEELVTCWQPTDDRTKPLFRWGIGGDFRVGLATSHSRRVDLEGRWIKNHDGMTTRFESGPDIRSEVYLRGVKIFLGVSEDVAAGELRRFLTNEFIQTPPPERPPVQKLDWEKLLG